MSRRGSRADLLYALTVSAPELATEVAAWLGYARTPEVPHVALAPTSGTEATEPTVEASDPAAEATPAALADVPFWRLEQYDALALEDGAVAGQVVPPPTRTVADPVWRQRPREAPPWTPLAAKRVVLTRLRRGLARWRPTLDIDLDAAVERLSRDGLLATMPRRQRRTWGTALYVIEDRARRLTPYWQDQDALVALLQAIYAPNSLCVARLGDGATQPLLRLPAAHEGQYAQPPPETVVLVLGDLGCLATQGPAAQRFWWHWGRHLRWQRCVPVALVPARVQDIPTALTRVWHVLRWDAAAPRGQALAWPSPLTPAQQLLTLLAPVVRLEPGLLREVRLLLTAGRRDPGLEARLWQDAALSSPHSRAAMLDPQQRQAALARFAEVPAPLRQAVLKLIWRWRGSVHAAVWFEELLSVDQPAHQALLPAAEVEDARTYVQALAERLEPLPDLPVATAAWIADLTARFPSAACQEAQISTALHRLYALVRPQQTATQVPAWFDPARLSPPGQAVHTYTLWQVGAHLVVQPASQPAPGLGSPLGQLHSASGEITLPPRLDEREAFWLGGRVPAWASAEGWDAYGPWASLRLGAVEQRLRWIAPGQCRMGAPETETEGFRDERPQHTVELTQGFWLWDTPCTQALWQEVMHTNPSQCAGAQHPVETVSWEEAQAFLRALNARLPTLDAHLPTEAQWEYACRAGTTTARYATDLEAIAWYDGNSQDTTHAVAQKRPNAWGLYDMLGHVWEWCHDGLRAYAPETVVDPLGPTDAGANRVVRGGSWAYDAQFVRAAFRYWDAPGYRFGDLGFRPASSGVSGQPVVPARAAGSAAWRQAEPAAPATPPLVIPLLRLSSTAPSTIALPAGGGFLVHSDHARLSVGQITRPAWASAIGRDRYGLWVTLAVRQVRQRLRWIPPGRFRMGSPPEEEGHYNDEGPQHTVQLTHGFWLWDTPCTQALWQAVMGRQHRSAFPGPQRPVESVSWEDCQRFLERLNAQVPGLAACLPTEAQWEYACRSGTATARYHEALDTIAWYGDNSQEATQAVGQKAPNAWGLYDMLGHVWEWCHDGQRAYTPETVVDPLGLTDAGAYRALRGGGWFNSAQGARAALRVGFHPGDRVADIGFRAASSGVSSQL